MARGDNAIGSTFGTMGQGMFGDVGWRPPPKKPVEPPVLPPPVVPGAPAPQLPNALTMQSQADVGALLAMMFPGGQFPASTGSALTGGPLQAPAMGGGGDWMRLLLGG